MRLLCLKTNQVITHKELVHTRYPKMVFPSDPGMWSDQSLKWAKARKIINTPAPEDNNTIVTILPAALQDAGVIRWLCRFQAMRKLLRYRRISYNGAGFEEIGGQLYQTWVRR